MKLYSLARCTPVSILLRRRRSQIEHGDEEQLGDDRHHGDSNNDGDDKTDGEEDHRSSSHLFRDGIEVTHYKRNPQSDK